MTKKSGKILTDLLIEKDHCPENQEHRKTNHERSPSKRK